MDILEQAILDAKNIREAAVSNAKATLAETFRPTLQRMISSRLEEEEGEEVEDEIEMPQEEPEMEPETEPAVEPEAEGDDLELDELLRELEGLSEEGEEEEEEEEEEVDLDELLAELRGEDEDMMEMEDEDMMEMEDEDMMEMEDEDMMESFRRRSNSKSKLVRENRKLKAQLKEAYNAVSVLKAAVNDVTLLNAKLMYATKISNNYTLTESQKTKVLETFDRANSVRECKLIYSTLAQSLTEGKKQVAPKKRAIVESTRTGFARKQNLNEGFDQRSRWQVLSGIKSLNS